MHCPPCPVPHPLVHALCVGFYASAHALVLWHADGVSYVWHVRALASQCALCPMRMCICVYDIRSQSDSVLRVLVFGFCLFVFRCASETLLEVAVGQ